MRATTYWMVSRALRSIFTFKLWDWERLGPDGLPRPVHIDHGLANIQWNRDDDWAARSAVNMIEELSSGPGWSEERTGLHELEFIETHRHWFTAPVEHDTHRTVAVMNPVEGPSAIRKPHLEALTGSVGIEESSLPT